MNPDNGGNGETSTQQIILNAEIIKTPESPYSNSAAVAKIKERKKAGLPIRIMVTDFDSTMTGSKPEETNKARAELEEQGYVFIGNTARTPEMVITKDQQNKSREFPRKPALLGKDEQGKKIYKDPAEAEPAGILDSDIVIGSTGTEILIKQKDGGYTEDKIYVEKQKAESLAWRSTITRMIDIVNSEKIANGETEKPLAKLKPFEDPQNYVDGKTDIYTPDLRMQMDFDSVEDKTEFLQNLRELRNKISKLNHELKILRKRLTGGISEPEKIVTQESIHTLQNEIQSLGFDEETIDNVHNFRLTDDSKPSENKYSAYLNPSFSHKARSTHHMLTSLADAAEVPLEKMDVLIAGDSKPDELMGLVGGLGTNTTFLLVGGSRLTESWTNKNVKTYSGQNVELLQKRFEATDRKGEYIFHIPRPEDTMNFPDPKVIVADQAYEGTKGPQSILAFLESQK